MLQRIKIVISGVKNVAPHTRAPRFTSFLAFSTEYLMKQLKVTMISSAVAFAVLATANVSAQDKPDGLFHGTANLGATFASGAVTNTTISAAFDMARKSTQDKLSFYGLAARGSTKAGGLKATTSDLYRLGARYDRDFNKQLFGYVSGDLERNNVVGLNLRAGGYVGLGYHVIATPVTTFDVFAGVGYNHYDLKGGDSDGAAEAMLGEESSHKISESTTFKQKLVIYPSFDSDFGYRAQWDSTLGVAMGGGWNMNLTGSLKYANKVYAVKKTESLLTVGFGYKF
jgi:putative salt-induced outer membrane protein